jgi:hypothetical protein
MAEGLMSITDYCKSRGISRNRFYHHRTRGVLEGCFQARGKKQLVVPEKADRALSENVRVNRGGETTKRKFRDAPDEQAPAGFSVYRPAEPAVDGLGAMFILHDSIASTFGLEFDHEALLQPFAEGDLTAHAEESMNYLIAALCDVAAGKDPVRRAFAAVVFTLSAIYPGAANWDESRIEEMIGAISDVANPKKQAGSKKGA